MVPDKRWPDYLLPFGIIACLLVIFLPLPTVVMDMLLAANLSLAIIILLSTIYVKSPLELSLFPSILLATTLGRLALNVATTRLILTKGATEHEMAAGGVIESFANFVTGDSLAVGLVIFSIMVVIQFVVITKGSSRISEVTARFALDGLPGRQMAIDAELNAGSIDAKEAQKLRQEVADHADFYGAMDGASKFVRGDAIAGVIITLINIGVGLAVGLSNQMTLAEAASTFTRLTIGDGLVSQLPALLISLAAGLLVTRSHSKTNLPTESINQFFSTPIVLVMTAVFLGVMVMIDLPAIPLMTLACGFLAVAYWVPDEKSKSAEASAAALGTTGTTAQPPVPDVGLDKLLSNDILEIELGLDLIRLADTRQGGTLLASIAGVRKQLAEEMGLVLPKIRIRDNLALDRNRYQVLLQGNVIEAGELNPTATLATDTGNATGPLEASMILGMANNVAMPQPAYWIEPENMLIAQHTGYQVHSAIDVLANQLKQLSLENAAHILTRDATRLLIDEVAKHSPSVVSELIPAGMSLAQVQQILKRLVSEGISIRPLSLILETLGDHCSQTKNHWELTEHVRVRLGRHISAGLAGAANEMIYAFSLASDLQDRVACAWDRDRAELRLGLPAPVIESICDSIVDVANRMAANGLQPIVLVDQSIRPVIAKLMSDRQHEVFVLGSKEVVSSQLEVIGEITCQQVASCEAMAA